MTAAGGQRAMGLRGHLAVFGLWLGLVALYTWPLAREPAHLFPDNHDPRLFSWVMVTIFRNLVSRPGLLLHGNAFYPAGQSLTFAEPLLTPALTAGPLTALTGNPVLAYNLTLLGFWALSGWAMHAVAWWLTGRQAAAFVAAAIFTLSPYRTELYLEFQMQMAFGIPLAVYTLVRFLEEQRARYLLAFVAVFWLQAVAVWYYAVILTFALAAVAVQYAALRWRGWRLRTVGAAGLGGGALALGLVPIAWPFFVTRRELGFERGLEDVAERSAEILTYLEVRSNWLYRAVSRGHYFETSLFLGGMALALAALGLLWRWWPPGGRGRPERWLGAAAWACLALGLVAIATGGRLRLGPFKSALSFSAVGVAFLLVGLARHAVDGWRRWRDGVGERRLRPRDWVGLLLGIAAVAFLLSLGPVVAFGGARLGPGLYAWLYPYLVPLRAIRAATRIGVLVIFAGALLAGFGVAWLADRLPRRRWAPLVGGAIVLLLLEYATFPLPYGRVASAVRPVDLTLARAPKDSVVLEWPTYVADADADAMFRSLGHGKRVVNGYSGFVPALLRDLSGLLASPGPPYPTPEAQAALRRIHPLRYLVVRLDDPGLPAGSRPTWLTLRGATLPLLRFRGTFGSEDLYEVVPLPERGAFLERWISYEFLLTHPVLHLTLRPLTAGPGLEQEVDLLLNGRLLRHLPVPGPTTWIEPLAPPFRRAAPNVLGLRYGYRRRETGLDPRYRIGTTTSASPADLRVVSGGQPHGDVASIAVNGAERAKNRRGYNLVALDDAGRALASETFDTFADPAAVRALVAWVGALPAGTVVAGAVKDEGSGQLTADAVRALGMLGVAGDLRGRFRESHAFVGVKGAGPGTAVEGLGARRLELVVGRPDPGLGFELEEFRLAAASGR